MPEDNNMNFIKYKVWPYVKVKMIYWWWVVKYGGKKNIPPDLVYNQMEKSFKKLNENLFAALRLTPDKIDKGEQKQINELLSKMNELGNELGKIHKK